jgi:hypothetical protein
MDGSGYMEWMFAGGLQVLNGFENFLPVRDEE